MRLLDRYVLRELFWPVVGSLFFFTFLMLITRLFRMTDLLLQTDIRGSLLLELLWILIVSLVTLTIPMAILLATIIGFGRMAVENEILAVRAGGLGLWKVFRPVIAAAAVIGVVLAYLNASVVPGYYARVRELLYDFRFDAIINLQPRTFYSELSFSDYDMTLYYDAREEAQSEDNLTIVGMRDVAVRINAQGKNDDDSASAAGQFGGRRETFIFARRGEIIGDQDTKSIQITLYDGTILPIQASRSGENNMMSFGRLTKSLQSAEQPKSQRFDSREASAHDLFRMLSAPPNSPPADSRGKVNRPWKDYYRAVNEMILRFSLPLACIAFVMIAMPLAIVVRPGAKSIAFMMTFFLMFIYYMILSWGRELGEQGRPMGWVLIVLPNFLLGGVGLWLMGRAVKR